MVNYGQDRHEFDTPTLEAFFDAMKQGTRHCPRGVEMLMEAKDVGMEDTGGEIIVQIVPTLIRSVVVDEYELYEYEFEGWILGDYGPDRIWVRGDLQTGDDIPGVIFEAHVHVIRPEDALSVPRNASP